MRSVLGVVRGGFSCERIPMSECPAWRFADGAISHSSGGFFSVVAVTHDDAGAPPTVLLHQPQSALNGLLTSSIDGETHFLLQARAEPGNAEETQYGPTVQSTPANYLRVHGGNPTPYLDLFFTSTAAARQAGDFSELDLGERYLFKNKRLIYVHLLEAEDPEPGFVWVPARTVQEAVSESTLLNTDLRSMFAVMPGSPWIDRRPDELGDAARRSLRRPVCGELIGSVLEPLGRPPTHVGLTSLDELDHWDLTDDGLIESEPARQGFDVHFFRVSAPSREVPEWTQPLVDSRSAGQVALALSVSEGVVFVLVRVAEEVGLSTGSAVFPTHLVYPGRQPTDAQSSVLDALTVAGSTTLLSTLESDEGGRFYHDQSGCELILTDELVEVGDGYHWITLAELRHLLGLSNVCAIQLRCISSMLLALR
jgi:oxidase EvaA